MGFVVFFDPLSISILWRNPSPQNFLNFRWWPGSLKRDCEIPNDNDFEIHCKHQWMKLTQFFSSDFFMSIARWTTMTKYKAVVLRRKQIIWKYCVPKNMTYMYVFVITSENMCISICKYVCLSYCIISKEILQLLFLLFMQIYQNIDCCLTFNNSMYS